MASGKVGLGQRGEELAAAALESCGFDIVTKNWRCRYGEVDIIASHNQDLYFVEVRTRRGGAQPMPEESLTPRKLHRMELIARAYLGRHAIAAPLTWHLSFLAIAMDRRGYLQRITFYADLDGEPQTLTWRPWAHNNRPAPQG
jgi:putative endonuclease